MTERATHVFVSYSRTDQFVVAPIVQIMRAIGADVFHDSDSIPYGKRWRPVIEESIHNAAVVIVFWSEHSRGSEEVRKEWKLALEADKDVVPALLDDALLDPELAEYQAIDLRSTVLGHSKDGDVLYSFPRAYEDLPEEVRRALFQSESNRHMDIIEADIAAAAASQVMAFLRKRSVPAP